MSTQKERTETNEKVDYIIEKTCKGNAIAAVYLGMISRCLRVIDDIYDQDHEVSREKLLEVMEYLFINIPANPFFIEHRERLFSQHISMWNSWMAANYLADGDETDKLYSHVLRDACNELLPIVAMLIGGPVHMRTISADIRTLFKKQLGE